MSDRDHLDYLIIRQEQIKNNSGMKGFGKYKLGMKDNTDEVLKVNEGASNNQMTPNTQKAEGLAGDVVPEVDEEDSKDSEHVLSPINDTISPQMSN